MRRLQLCFIFSCVSLACLSQEETLGKKIDQLTFDWDLQSSSLNSYEGLVKFCRDVEYRKEVIQLMNDIHHYDSVLYSRLKKANRLGGASKEVKKTIQEIEKFETKYSAKNFIHFLHDECNDSKDIEKHSEDLKSDKSYDSYDGQVYIVENLLNKYIKNITKGADRIRDHVHHLHIQ